jgi:hypothetical protein
MIDRKVLFVWLLLAALFASHVVEAKKRGKKIPVGKRGKKIPDGIKKADLGASECANGKCKLKRSKDKNIFTANTISIQLKDDGIIHEFVGGSRQGGKNQQSQWYGVSDGVALNLIESSEGLLFGSAQDKDHIYDISTDNDGNYIVEGKATADFPDELEDANLDFRQTFPGNHTGGEGLGEAVVDDSMRKDSLRGSSSSSSILNTTQRQLAEDANTILDIMVVWTTNAECNKFGKSSGCTTTAATETTMRGMIDLAVAETNVAFEESGVHATLRLVHAYRHPTYTEYTKDKLVPIANALYDITNGDYAAMDDVHTMRADVGADLVAMIVHDPGSCGFGWNPTVPIKEYMFSVSHWSCTTGYFSFGHEIGHNMVSSKR